MRKWANRKIIRVILIIFLVIIVGFGVYSIYSSYKISQLSSMAFNEMLEYTTKDNKEAIISVGIIQNGKMTYEVYGESGTKLFPEKHVYEIGSITKTFTTSLLSKAISEGEIGLESTIDEYLTLPEERLLSYNEKASDTYIRI